MSFGVDERIVPKKKEPIWKRVIFFLIKVLIWFFVCSTVCYGFQKLGVFEVINKYI